MSARPDGRPTAPWSAAPRAASLPVGPRVLVACALYAALMGYLTKLPCRLVSWETPGPGLNLCYSDLPKLYVTTGMAEGRFPYVHPDALLEYPVLQTVVATLTGMLTYVLDLGSTVHAQASIYLDLNAALLALVWAAIVLVLGRLVLQPGHALMAALAPGAVVTMFINWDLWAVLCTVLALWAFRRQRWLLGGALLGVGTALKLFPFLVLGALVVLALRRREAGPVLRAAAGTVGAWAVANVPLALLDPLQWGWFWRFSQDRGAGFSSVWYWWNGVAVPRLGGEALSADRVTSLALVSFALACVLILVWGLATREEPRLEELAFLVVAAFVLTNKVYSPQFVLWLVPLLVLVRPRTAEFVVWQLVEVLHWAAVFLLLGHWEVGENPLAAYDAYFASVALHTLTVGALMARVVVTGLRRRPEPA